MLQRRFLKIIPPHNDKISHNQMNPLKNHMSLSKTRSNTLTKLSFNLHYEVPNIPYRTGIKPKCTLCKGTPFFLHFITCTSTAQQLNHKCDIFFLRRAYRPTLPPPIINTILYGITNGINKIGPIQLPTQFHTKCSTPSKTNTNWDEHTY